MAAHADALVVADGDVDGLLLEELASVDDRPLLIAADGGAVHLLEAGLTPDVVVGDFDSLSARDRRRLEALGVELLVMERDKDESDMELCLLTALERGAARIVILGALGVVRPEHSLANLLLLADPRLDAVEVAIAGRGSRITRVGAVGEPGACTIEGQPRDFVSLFAVGGAVEGVTTSGLRFGLRDETLLMGPSRGLSNELLEPVAKVTTRDGCLIVIHTRRSMADAAPTGGI